jgi:homoserine dehydrogenase
LRRCGWGVAGRVLRGPVVHGLTLSLARVLVRNLAKPRIPESVKPHLTTSALDVMCDSKVSVIAECIGGLEPAGEYVESALRDGKHVVTANKALIAERGAYLSAVAAARGVALRYEAAVGGAINGTTNFILSAMEEGAELAGALREAQALGFAEADASTDLEGVDAAYKLAILIATAFGAWPAWRSMRRRGISDVSKGDLAQARRDGTRLRLVAYARREKEGIAATVTPAFVPVNYPFAAPQGVENVVRIVGRYTGPVLMAGLGAGREATASAVLSDVYDIAAWLAAGGRSVAQFATPEPIREINTVPFALNETRGSYPIWEDATIGHASGEIVSATGS